MTQGIKTKSLKSGVFFVLLVFTALTCMATFFGCSDDDDDDDKIIINVCNRDNAEYFVRLIRESDNSKADDLRLSTPASISNMCDDFDNVQEGWYTISIHRDDTAAAASTSSRFHVGGNDHLFFWIDSTGTIDRDGGGDGDIRVCNGDNHEYFVKLFRKNDNSFVDDIRVGNAASVSTHCDTFETVADGTYYLGIYRDDTTSTPTDTSVDFTFSRGDHEFFRIDDTGDIIKE